MTSRSPGGLSQRPAATAGLGWLALGGGLMLFTNGHWTVPALVWLAPAPWLVYLDRGRHRLQLPFLLVAGVLVHFVVWRGIIPAPGWLYYLIAGIYALVYFLPYVAHRLLAANTRSFARTLVFPTAWVALEFLFQRLVTPYGSWASFAYTQADSLPLLQVTAVTGIAGLSFLMTWIAAVVARCVQREPSRSQRARGALTGAVALLAVVAFGQLRLAQPAAGGDTLRAAGLAPDLLLDREVEAVVNEVRRGSTPSDELMDRLRQSAGRLNANLLERTRIEARAGAELIAWSETAARLLKSGEEGFLARLGDLTRAEGVHLLASMGVWNPDGRPLLENKIVAVDPLGHIAWQFHKAHPIVGAESMLIDPGDGKVALLETAKARLGAVICHDMDFTDFLHQASTSKVDLLVAPSADWPLIAKLHADMAKLRAVEHGVTLFRPTSGGRSIAVDGKGRPLAVVDHPRTTIVAFLPVQGVDTVYGVVGDAFAWLCVIALTLLVASAVRTAWRRP